MKVLIFTKEDSPEVRSAKELGEELLAEKVEVEYLDTDEAEGSSKAELYDVYSTPTFVVVRDDGSLVNIWRGYVPPKGEISQQAQA